MLKNLSGFKIVGINLLAFVIYAIILILIVNGIDAAILFANFFFYHFLISLVIAAFTKNWYWVFSGLLILIIGFSICSKTTIIPEHH